MAKPISAYVFPGLAEMQSPDLHLIAVCVCEAFNQQLPADTIVTPYIMKEHLRVYFKEEFTPTALRAEFNLDKNTPVTWAHYIESIGLNPQTLVRKNRLKLFALSRHMVTGIAREYGIPALQITDFLQRHRTTYYNSVRMHEGELYYRDYRRVYEDAKKRLYLARYGNAIHA